MAFVLNMYVILSFHINKASNNTAYLLGGIIF